MRIVAKRLNCHPSSVSRLQQRLRLTGSTSDRPRPGQPRVTNPRQNGCFRQLDLRNRFQTAPRIGGMVVGRRGVSVSSNCTASSASSRATCKTPLCWPVLTRLHRKRRLQWAALHLRLRSRQRANVVFSDESRFTLSRSEGRAIVWRRVGERYANCCILEAERLGRAWAAHLQRTSVSHWVSILSVKLTLYQHFRGSNLNF